MGIISHRCCAETRRVKACIGCLCELCRWSRRCVVAGEIAGRFTLAVCNSYRINAVCICARKSNVHDFISENRHKRIAMVIRYYSHSIIELLRFRCIYTLVVQLLFGRLPVDGTCKPDQRRLVDLISADALFAHTRNPTAQLRAQANGFSFDCAGPGLLVCQR